MNQSAILKSILRHCEKKNQHNYYCKSEQRLLIDNIYELYDRNSIIIIRFRSLTLPDV